MRTSGLTRSSLPTCFFLLLGLACASTIDEFSGKRLYTAYNIWYEPGKEDRLYCINYKTGSIVLAGTEVRDITPVGSERGFGQGGDPFPLSSFNEPAFSFVTEPDGRKYVVCFSSKHHPGKTVRDYMRLMFSERDFSRLTEGLNEDEIDAIKGGVVKIGMSKRAVLVSYGYPPEHRTPSLDDDEWVYWMNRWRSETIRFDKDGKAIAPTVMEEDSNRR